LRSNALRITAGGENPRPLLLSPSAEPAVQSVSMTASDEVHMICHSSTLPALSTVTDPATIGKSLEIKGEVIGSESLYIDGKVEGGINLPGSRVTVGRDAQVSANITAREVILLGNVTGNINASDRVDIRSNASLTGNVTAQRINVGDGAILKGWIDIEPGP
jgi:cytoskeletal protein CcmA (bactofilin family)